jgi:hypothetical protein
LTPAATQLRKNAQATPGISSDLLVSGHSGENMPRFVCEHCWSKQRVWTSEDDIGSVKSSNPHAKMLWTAVPLRRTP